MKSTRYSGGHLRQVLTAVVTDPIICSRVAEQWPLEGLFDAKWANLVAGWCVRYVRQYGTCPNDQLTGLFREWAETKTGDEETIEAVEKFIGSLSDDYERAEPVATDYMLDLSTRYFNQVKLKREIEILTEDMDRGLVDEPFERLRQLTKISLQPSPVDRVNRSFEDWRDAIEDDNSRPLIGFGGGLGRFFGNELQRETLFSFMAPDKTGKSFWLMTMAYQAARQGNRVLLVDAGDMGRKKMMRRLIARSSRQPLWPCGLTIPTAIADDGSIETVQRDYDGVSVAAAFKRFNKVCRGADRFRLLSRPNSSLSVAELSDLLSEMDRTEGWVPDVIVIDYADILAPPAGVRESIDQIDGTWRHLRRLSQEKNALVMTASQTKADAYLIRDGGVITRRHFSGSKTKLAHVSGMIGINVTRDEKRAGICRLNWILSRDGTFAEHEVCWCAGNLALADPAIVSCF